MASKFRLDVTVQENANGAISQIQPTKKSPAMILDNLGRYFTGLAMGRVGTSTRVVTTAVVATGSIVFASMTTGDTVTVGATTLTGSNGAPANENQFDVSGNDASDATNFAACVNAHSVLSKYLSASANSATVTLTCLVPGVIGNAITLSASAHATPTAFASGSEDTPVTLAHGS